MKQTTFIIAFIVTIIGCSSTSSTKLETNNVQHAADSLNIDVTLIEISKSIFENYDKNKFHSKQRLEKIGFSIEHNCNEICETYLVDNNTQQKMPLLSSFDAGILDLILSRSTKHFITYSSYDGPDYTDYYGHRSEFTLYRIKKQKKNTKIEERLFGFSKNWSIARIVYISDNYIALKLYEERYGDGTDLNYKYFKLRLVSKKY